MKFLHTNQLCTFQFSNLVKKYHFKSLLFKAELSNLFSFSANVVMGIPRGKTAAAKTGKRLSVKSVIKQVLLELFKAGLIQRVNFDVFGTDPHTLHAVGVVCFDLDVDPVICERD